MQENSESIVNLIADKPGLNKFEIANKLRLNLIEVQRILKDLQNKNEISSGLQKDEKASIYERRYFSL